MTCKHFLKNIFLVNECCFSLSDKIPKKTFTKLLEKKFALTVSFYKKRKATFIKTLFCIFPNMFFSV